MSFIKTLCIVFQMINDKDTRLLMSDSLLGMIPDFEDNDNQIKLLSNTFIVAALEILVDQNIDVFTGSLTGISFDKLEEIKLDIRLELNIAYDIIKKFKSSKLLCKILHLYYVDNEICFEGPYKIFSTKVMDFDRESKLCTVGFDLIKL